MRLKRLSALDAAFLSLECPEAPMHVGWAALFSSPPDGSPPSFAAVRSHVERRLSRAPRYRQRLAEVPLGLSDPVWVDDEHFDVADHVRHAWSTDFGGLVDEVLSAPLSYDRPLWELWIADGLEGGGLGVVGKAHHCLVDGLGAVELMALLLDLTPEPEHGEPAPWVPRERPAPIELLGDAVGGGLASAWKLGRVPLELARAPGRALDLPRQAWRSGRALLNAVTPPAPPSHLNGPMTARRHLACLSRPLADLKTIRRRFDTTINDVLLAASAGALRSLHRERDDAARDVKAMVPVSVGETDGEWGNKIAFLFLALPCQEPDPLWRLRDVHLAMRERKRERQPEGAEAILAALSYAPRPARRLASQAIASPLLSNVTISNIPGPEMPLYLMGCRAEQAYPVVPLTADHGMSIGMTSVNAQACFGIYAHSGLAQDADRVAHGIGLAIDELLRLSERIPHEQRADPIPIRSTSTDAPDSVSAPPA